MVVVDQALCSGCGICIELCPEVFIWGPDGKAMAFKNYCEILEKYKIDSYFRELKELIFNFKNYNVLGLNPREFKLKKGKILSEMKKA